MTTAIQTTGKKSIKDQLEGDQFKLAVAKVLPKHLTPDRFVRVAIMAMTRTPKLAQCEPASFFQALMSLSQYGLEPDGRRAHLIPFENRKRGVTECQLIIDYKGLAELVMRSGIVSNLHADTVCENDTFDYDRGALAHHKIDFRNPRGPVYAVYALCRFKDGSEKCDVMTREEIETVRSRSRAGQSGPWVTDWSEMAKKTVFRRLSKWLPLSPEIRDAVEADDDIETRRVEAAKPVFSTEKPLFEIPAAVEVEAATPATDTDHDLGPVTQTATQPGTNYLRALTGLCKLSKITEAELIEFLRTTQGLDDSISTLSEASMVAQPKLQWCNDNWSTVSAEIARLRGVK